MDNEWEKRLTSGNLQFEDCWPNAKDEQWHVTAMMQRLVGWKQLIDWLEQHVREIAAAEAQYGQAYSNIHTNSSSFVVYNPVSETNITWTEFTETMPRFGNVIGTFSLLNQRSNMIAKKHLHAATFLREMLAKVIVLKDNIHTDATEISKEINRLFCILKESRMEALKWMNNYEKAYWSYEAFSHSATTPDPWLTENILQKKLTDLQEVELAFQEAVLGFREELEKIDTYFMENIQIFMKDFLKSESAFTEELSSIFSSVQQMITTFHPTVSFQEFAKESNIESPNLWKKEVKKLKYRYQRGTLAQVYKCGYLYRRIGTVRYAWKKSFVVITTGNFLHCYDMEIQYTDPMIALSESDVDSGPMTLAQMNANSKSNGQTNTSNNGWPLDLLATLNPTVSLCLRRAHIESETSANNDEASKDPSSVIHCFDVVAPSTSRFSVSSTVRVSFLCPNPKVMKEWMDAVKYGFAPDEGEYLDDEDNLQTPGEQLEDDFVLLHQNHRDQQYREKAASAAATAI